MNEGTRLQLIDYDAGLLDPLLAMWRASFEAGVGIVDPNPLQAQRQYFLSQLLPRHRIRLALLGTQLVGFSAASDDMVAQLHVRVSHHRQGIGSVLLDEAKARSGGSLWLYTFARNRNARAFYEHHAFVAVAHGLEPTWQLEDVRYEWQAPAEG